MGVVVVLLLEGDFTEEVVEVEKDVVVGLPLPDAELFLDADVVGEGEEDIMMITNNPRK